MAPVVSQEVMSVRESSLLCPVAVDLSIVIVNWNSSEYLAKAIDSLESQTTGLRFEIVVIDSGSFDGCASLLQGGAYASVRFLQSEENIGFARANNMAFLETRGETILFLNPDTEVRGGAIAELYTHLASSERVGIVGPTLLNSDGSVQGTCVRAFPTILNQVLECEVLRKCFRKSRLWGARPLFVGGSKAPQRVDAVSGACLMVKRRVFEEVGKFSGDYFMYSEDIDLCLKVRRAGYRTHYVPTSVVIHHGGGSSSKAAMSTFSAVMIVESRWRFFRKMRSVWYARGYRCAMFAVSVARIVVLPFMWLLPVRVAARLRSENASAIWLARLRWSLGWEDWIQEVGAQERRGT